MSNFDNKVGLPSIRVKNILLVTFVFVSVGSLIMSLGGNFDVTAHLLQTPEIFFTPEHIMIYTGYSMMIASGIICFFLFILKKQVRASPYSLALKLVIIGAPIMLISGPLDFWWHTTFGFDGFLSPNHMVSVSGILTLLLGSIIGLVIMIKEFPTRKNTIKSFFAITFAVFWFTIIGTIHLIASPFSKGEVYDFTPDPYVAVIIAITAIPFVSSMIFWSISKADNRFGTVSIVTLIMVLINIITNVIFVEGLHVYLPWFIIPVIGAILADYVIHNKKSNIFQNHSEKIAGAIIGGVSFMLIFPYIGLTYLRLYVADGVNTYDVLPSSESLVAEVWLLVILPGAIIGMIGMMFAKKKLTILQI